MRKIAVIETNSALDATNEVSKFIDYGGYILINASTSTYMTESWDNGFRYQVPVFVTTIIYEENNNDK